jgi:hypothetical protein
VRHGSDGRGHLLQHRVSPSAQRLFSARSPTEVAGHPAAAQALQPVWSCFEREVSSIRYPGVCSLSLSLTTPVPRTLPARFLIRSMATCKHHKTAQDHVLATRPYSQWSERHRAPVQQRPLSLRSLPRALALRAKGPEALHADRHEPFRGGAQRLDEEGHVGHIQPARIASGRGRQRRREHDYMMLPFPAGQDWSAACAWAVSAAR